MRSHLNGLLPSLCGDTATAVFAEAAGDTVDGRPDVFAEDVGVISGDTVDDPVDGWHAVFADVAASRGGGRASVATAVAECFACLRLMRIVLSFVIL